MAQIGFHQVVAGLPGNVGFWGQDSGFLTTDAAYSRGDIVAVDLGTVSDYTFTTTDAVATADLEAGIFGVILEDVASGGTARVLFRGIVECETNGAIALGDTLGGVNAQTYLDQTGAAAKIIALPLETQASGVNLTHCMFNGVEGFAVDHA